MNIKTKENLKIQDIKIPENFKNNPPSAKKMGRKWEYYRQHNELKEEIVVNEYNILTDGYTSYLIAEADGIKKVKVTKITSEPWIKEDRLNIKDYQVYVSKNTKRKQMFDNQIHTKDHMYIKDIIKICIALTLIVIGMYGIIWYIKQIIAMCMEVGG